MLNGPLIKPSITYKIILFGFLHHLFCFLLHEHIVCYKESSSEQLEDFCAEVRGEGRMSEDTQQMFTDLQEKTAAPPTDKPAVSQVFVD